jgi:hypothetical protein
MVDFRYHLVSLISVFLALAIGVVFGTTALNGVVLDNLRKQVDTQSHEKAALHDDLDDARGTISRDDDWVRAAAPILIGGSLTGRRVVVITAPGVAGAVHDGVLDMVRLAGGRPVAGVRLQPKLSDPEAASDIASVTARAQPTCTAAPAATTAPPERAAIELAAVLTRDCDAAADDTLSSREKATPATATTRLLTEFAASGLVKVDGGNRAAAAGALVVVLLPPGEVSKATAVDASIRRAPWFELVRALASRTRAIVVAAPRDPAGTSGPLAELRNDDALSSAAATVDGVERPVGRVTVVQALVSMLGGTVGSYGGLSSDDAPLPTASASPS